MHTNISIYIGALVITVFGAGATLLIVNTAYSIEPAYLSVDSLSDQMSP